MSETELRALGYVAKDGKAVKVGSGVAAKDAAQTQNSTAATASPYRSKTEATYAAFLDALIRSGEILNWRYEAVTLRLGDRVRFTPDFRVEDREGRIELHEVKGAYTREDARVKLQVAATLFPEYRFQLCTYSKGNWTIARVRAA